MLRAYFGGGRSFVRWFRKQGLRGGVEVSVNLHLGVVIRGYQPENRSAIESAIRNVLVQEEIAEDLPSLSETIDAQGHVLESRSDPARPVIITGAYEWAKHVEQALREAAEKANCGPCQVRFDWTDADEELEVADND